MSKGYRTKVNGECVTGWCGYEVIGFTSPSPFCLGECEKPLTTCCEEMYLVPGGYMVCGECIDAYCEKNELDDPKITG